MNAQDIKHLNKHIGTPNLQLCHQGSGRPDWLHEIKHDGYRLIVQKINQKCVRLFTRNGHDWADRYP